MKIEPHEYYIVSGRELEQIKNIEHSLYANDTKKLTADDTRNMANYLNQVFFSRIEGPIDITKL